MYVIVTILFIGMNASLEAWPVWAIVSAGLTHRALSSGQTALVVASFVALVVMGLGVFALAARNGIRALENLRQG